MTTTGPATALPRSLRTLIGADPNLRQQASRFLDWFLRLPCSVTVTGAFKGWAESKDFTGTQRGEIWGYVLELLDEAIDGPFDPKVSAALDQLLDGGKG
ncbi:MAG TPA: hypothetical protein VGC81_13300 [Candidatus Methylomirabilis sp.]